MSDDIREKVDAHQIAIFGDPRNMKASPGIINEQARMSQVQERTNEILSELRNAVLWINRIIVTGFITALIAIVLKGTGN